MAYKYTLPGATPSSLKEPSLEVVAAVFCPSTPTFAPATVLPFTSSTLPRILADSAAFAWAKNMSKHDSIDSTSNVLMYSLRVITIAGLLGNRPTSHDKNIAGREQIPCLPAWRSFTCLHCGASDFCSFQGPHRLPFSLLVFLPTNKCVVKKNVRF